MNLKSIVIAAALGAALISPVSVQAGGWGRGPSIGGWHPLSPQVVPAKPLAGVQMALGDAQRGIGKAGTVVWDAGKRPFVETWKFLGDPTAGLRRTAQNYINQAETWLTALVKQVAIWLSIGFGVALALSVSVAMGFAALIVRFALRQRTTPVYRFAVKDEKNVPLLDVEFEDEAEGRKAQAAIESAMKRAQHVQLHQATA